MGKPSFEIKQFVNLYPLLTSLTLSNYFILNS